MIPGNLFSVDTTLRVISESIPAGMIITSLNNGSVVFANKSFNEILGCKTPDIMGKSWEQFFWSHEDREELMVKFVETGIVRNHQLPLRGAGGTTIWVMASMAAIEVSGEDFLLTTFVNITELKNAEQKIAYLANHDSLTSLSSSHVIRSKLDQITARSKDGAESSAILFVDLDGFKAINDRYGHDAGDNVLQRTSERLRASVRGHDMIGRIGGDEFVILLTGFAEGIDLEFTVKKIAERLISAISKPIEIDGIHVVVSASIGIAYCPEHHSNPEELLKLADSAMYSVKNTGKNGFAIADSLPIAV